MYLLLTLLLTFALLFIFVVQLKLHSINRLYLDDIGPIPQDFIFPRVTIIVTGRNEEKRIGEAVRSMAATAYPFLSVVAVDDRSNDATGSILDQIAEEHSNVKV